MWKEDYWLVKLVRRLSPLGSLMHVLFWPFLIFIVYGSLNYSGFCFSELRYLPDKERISRAITEINKGRYLERGVINSKTGKKEKILEPVPYENVEAFLDANPDCCVLVPKDRKYGDDYPPPIFLDRIFGSCNYIIAVDYVYKYRETPILENGEAGVSHERKEFVSDAIYSGNCGQLYKD